MPLTVASIGLSDDAFLSAFHHCELPLSMFRHGDHLRFAWLTLHGHEFDEALQIVREGILRFATHYKVAHIFHETITAAWVHLLASHREPTFSAFLAKHQGRLNMELLHRFWTPEVLDSPDAREHWLPPDRASLPDRV
jgi:hypothetical protein